MNKIDATEVIKQIDKHIADLGKSHIEIEIGARDPIVLHSLLMANNKTTDSVRFFPCNKSDSQKIINHFLELGLKQSKFTMNAQQNIFIDG